MALVSWLPLLFLGFQLSSGFAPAPASGRVFLSGPAGDRVLQRHRRHNSHLLEELQEGNLERECVEESCDFEEAREIFENNEKTKEFWEGYVDGNQCEPSPCLNQGTCEDHIGSYSCSCPSDFTGRNCEIIIARRCDVNNGDCMHFCEPEETGAKCSCATGYRLMENGFDCEPKVAFPCGRTTPTAAGLVARRSLRGRDATSLLNTTSLPKAAATRTPPSAANTTKVSFPNTNNSVTPHSVNKLPPWVNSEAEEPTEDPTEEDPAGENPTDEGLAEEQPHPYKRIVGGMGVTPGEIPWQVALMKRSSGRLVCGGSILSQRWVITAAHCLVESRGPLFIRVGEHNIYIREGTEKDYSVLKQHIYPLYNATISLYNHDIALLYTEQPITFSATVRPICVGPRAFTEALLKEASPATVSGWGQQHYLGFMADTLQKVEVPFIDRAQCKSSSSAAITQVMFCAGYDIQARDACQGDSGGPHANIIHNTWFLTGIVSWGEECAKEGKYGVYTHVSHYYHWINRVMGTTKHRLALDAQDAKAH